MNEGNRTLNSENARGTNPPSKEQVYERATELLHELGVPANIRGFNYLRDAIMICYFEKEAINAITKLLYPSIATKNGTFKSRVERTIRHAIDVCFDRGNTELLNSIFKYSYSSAKGKPTNSEFIALITDKLHIEFKDYVLP